MDVSTFIQYARHSELHQLDIGEDDSSILSFINLGVLELHKRFPLSLEEMVFSLNDGQTVYLLPSHVIRVESTEISPIADTTLYEEEYPVVVRIIGTSSIQIANPSEDFQLTVYYAKSPDTLQNLSDALPIPDTLIEPLLHFVGYKAKASIDSSINSENNTHYMRFEASCKSVVESGVFAVVGSDGMKFKTRGFC